MKITQFIQKDILPFIFFIGLCATVVAQRGGGGDEIGGGSTGGTPGGYDCNGLGTAISNGIHYARTEPLPSPDPSFTFIDPGLTINAAQMMSAGSGVLAGSSNALQTIANGGVYAGITTKASCVTNASFVYPPAGGSGDYFWDTGSGMNPPAGATYPYTNLNDTDMHSRYGCNAPTGSIGGVNYRDYTFTLDFAGSTLVDGLYWESFEPGPLSTAAGTTWQVFVNGVSVTTSTLTSSVGSTISANDGLPLGADLTYFSMTFDDLYLSGTGNTITVRGLDGIARMGDFAVLGCCVVPEPSSAMLLLSGSALALFRRRRI